MFIETLENLYVKPIGQPLDSTKCYFSKKERYYVNNAYINHTNDGTIIDERKTFLYSLIKSRNIKIGLVLI